MNRGGNAWFQVGDDIQPNVGDFHFYGGNNSNEVFCIYDDIGSIDFKTYGKTWLTYSADGAAWAKGTWNFSAANVKGVYAYFA